MAIRGNCFALLDSFEQIPLLRHLLLPLSLSLFAVLRGPGARVLVPRVCQIVSS